MESLEIQDFGKEFLQQFIKSNIPPVLFSSVFWLIDFFSSLSVVVKLILVLSEDNRDIVKIWSIENIECICSLNFEKKQQNIKNIFSLCFLKDNTQINIAIKFNDIYNIRLFDLSGKKIKEIKLYQDNKYCGIESYYDQTQKTSYIIISSENIIKSYDCQQDLVYKKYISYYFISTNFQGDYFRMYWFFSYAQSYEKCW